MKIRRAILLFIIFGATCFSMGCEEDPSIFKADIIIRGNSISPLILPYEKPAGVSGIYNLDRVAIKIHKIYADGKKVNAKRQFMGADETYDMINILNSPPQKQILNVTMKFHTVYEDPTKIYYRANTLSYRHPISYFFPYRTKELYIIYSVVFPEYNGKKE